MSKCTKSEKKDTDGVRKKPMTAFFLFTQEERKKEAKISGKEAGKRWKELPEEKKQPFIEQHKKALMEYETYMRDVEGISLEKDESHDHFSKMRVRAVITSAKGVRQMNPSLYNGFAKLLVNNFGLYINRNSFLSTLGKL
eukprot:TRINITY_DN902_c0_g1_i1.p1 TRINITY_DN902_c0_g1~~TRINITY_DN902_c0_g1_i1.p1  ORF type:complete len:140 (+),score=42.26 TRINITY_DN902_c0_g1_i1:85-504(+)